MRKPRSILTCLLGALLAGIPAAHASLAIANGNFETGAGNNIDNVNGWLDNSNGTFWQGTWQTNNAAITPNGTAVVVLGSYESGAIQGTASADANGGNYLYQEIGTADGVTSLQVQFDWGAPNDDPGGRNLGITVGVYAYDGVGAFTPADNTDVRGASGVTFLGSQSFSQISTGVDGLVGPATATLDISGAGTRQLFLRFNNYRPATTQSWTILDNVVIVSDSPTFTTEPADYFGSVGATVTLTSAAISTPAPSYQWEYSTDDTIYTDVTDGGNVSGATTAILTITDAAFAQNGYYRVVADNGSSVISEVAQVGLTYPVPVITGQPAGGAVQVGSDVSFTVTATGLGTLSYQWYEISKGPLTDSGNISGATTATLSLANVQPADAGNYYCEVTDHAATEDASGEINTVSYSTGASLEVFEAPAEPLLSFEPFAAYPVPVALTGQNPVIGGYVNAWADLAFGDAVPATIAGSLNYGGAGYAAGIGGKVGKGADDAGISAANSGRVERLLDVNLKGTALSSRTIYLSWLFQTGNEGAAVQADNYQVLGLWNGNSDNDSLRVFEAGVALGDFGTPNYAFRVGNSTSVSLGVAPDTGVRLFVAKFVLSPDANGDSVTVWIDPVLGAGEPTGGALVPGVNLAFDRLTLSDYASNSSNWDEIRWGTTFSSVTVEQPAVPLIPEITVHPDDQFGFVGGTVTLGSAAIANPEATYQWQFSGNGSDPWTPITGATSSTLVLDPAEFSDNGFYRVVASNVNGFATSEDAKVELTYPDPAINQQPASVMAALGTNTSLSVSAAGLGNLTYQWYKVDAGGDIQFIGETTATLDFTGVDAGDVGQYYVIVSDDAAVADEGFPTQTTSNIATLSVADLQVTASPAAPATDSFDQFYLPGNVDDVDNIDGSPGGVPIAASGANDASTYVAFDKTSQGMTFTTGSDPLGYTLGSITVRHVLWNNFLGNGTYFDLQNGDTLEFQFGTVSGTTKTPIFDTNTAVFSGTAMAGGGTSGSGTYLTFNLAAAGIATLAPNTTYYFEIASETGDAYFELSGTSVDGYAGGTAFRGDTMTTIDGTYAALAGDRAFHVDLTGLSGPGNDFATWISGYPVGGQNGFTADADGDGIENGLENFFGTDPSASSQGIVQIAKTGNTVTFRHPQNAAPASDVSAAYRWSADLTTFHADGGSSGGTTVSFVASPDTPSVGITTVTGTITGTTPAKLFVTVAATLASP